MSIDASLFGDGDFIQVRAALIAEVGAVEAIVLTRIYFRASEDYRNAYERDDHWWWRAPATVIAEETGLSEKQVKRSLTVLRDGDYIVTEQHQIEGRYDRALSVRVNVAGGTVDRPHRAHEDRPYRADVPIKTIEDIPTPTPSSSSRATRLVEGWRPKPETVAAIKAECPGLDLTREHRKFEDHWIAASDRLGFKKDWERTWKNWMRSAYERIPSWQKGVEHVSEAASVQQVDPHGPIVYRNGAVVLPPGYVAARDDVTGAFTHYVSEEEHRRGAR